MGATTELERRLVIAERLQRNHTYSPTVLSRLVDFQLSLEADDDRANDPDPLNSRRARILARRNRSVKTPSKSAYKQAKEASMDDVCKKAATTLPEVADREIKAQLKHTDTNNPTSVDWRDPDYYHYTWLHKAAEAHDLPEIIRLVEQAHANPNIKGNDHWTPLGLAVQLGFDDIVTYLRDK